MFTQKKCNLIFVYTPWILVMVPCSIITSKNNVIGYNMYIICFSCHWEWSIYMTKKKESYMYILSLPPLHPITSTCIHCYAQITSTSPPPSPKVYHRHFTLASLLSQQYIVGHFSLWTAVEGGGGGNWARNSRLGGELDQMYIVAEVR